jgi:hypothetical protein
LSDFLTSTDRVKLVWKGLSQESEVLMIANALQRLICAGIIELARRFILPTVFSFSVVTAIDILDTVW